MSTNPKIDHNFSFVTFLDDHIRQHSGWTALEDFGKSLADQALNERALKTFFASTGLFFREIPGGILALALRVTDDRIGKDRFGAVGSAAPILLAAVDEYGLGNNSTGNNKNHHQLFATMVKRFGLQESDLSAAEYIIPEAVTLTEVTRKLYREGSIAASVGFHYASEITSDREFQLCYAGLAEHQQVYMNNPAQMPPQKLLDFYYVHTIVEEEHGAASAEATAQFETSDTDRQAMLDGAEEFMNAYGDFWVALNRALQH